MNSKKKVESFDFEKGMQRLDEIIAEFDEGGLSLDQMEKYFNEGMELIQKCSHRLDEFETKVTTLLEKFEDDFDSSSLSDDMLDNGSDDEDELIES